VIRTSTSAVSYDKGADVIKITVAPAHSALKLRPGQYYYIYSPLTWNGWGNHLVPLGSYSRPRQAVKSRQDSLFSNKDASIMDGAIPWEWDSPPRSRCDWGENETRQTDNQTLVFWLRPTDAWSKALRDACEKSPGGIVKPRIMIEGPYGRTAHLHNYEHVVFIAGGTGISAVLPYLEEHIHRANSPRMDSVASPKTALRTRQVNLLWTCKTSAFIHNLCAKELRPALSRYDVRAAFFSTSSVHTRSVSKGTEAVHTATDVLPLSIDVNQGRPDITGAILKAARINDGGGSKAGRLAVFVCGPPSMADEARNAIHLSMKEGCDKIDYFEETSGR
jgi:hypothetical protein